MRLTWNKKHNEIRYYVDLPEDLRRYMPQQEFVASYQFNTKDMHDRTAAIPGVGSLLPLSWLTGEDISVPDLDREYVAGIRRIVDYFLPPNVRGAEVLIDNETREMAPLYTMGSNNRQAILMTLGADSTYAYAQYKETITDIITLWGAQKNMEGWSVYTRKIQEFAKKKHLTARFGGCNIRACTNEYLLEKDFEVSWWILGHSTMMLSWAAPICYHAAIPEVLISSTWDPGFDQFWGSCPGIDESIRWNVPGTTVQVQHTEQETRLNKFKYIVNSLGPTYLHICPFNVPNCGGCAKCIQAAVSLKQLGANPKDYGFKEPDMNKARQYKQDNPPFWEDLEV